MNSTQNPLGLLLTASLAFFATAAVVDAPGGATVVDLQKYRQEKSIRFRSGPGAEGVATLVNLNPAIRAWYLLKVVWKSGEPESVYHLENPRPRVAELLLDRGLVIAEGSSPHLCDVLGTDALQKAQASRQVFAPICGGRVYVRNPAVGRRTTLETATEFFRDRVWGGEKLIELGHTVMGDARREVGQAAAGAGGAAGRGPAGEPRTALVDSRASARPLISHNLGIPLVGGAERTGMTPGAWYGASGNPGVYVSILQPNLIDPAVLQSFRGTVHALDGVEAASLCYLIAFDLDRFDVAFAMGTDHPRVDWSAHMNEGMKNPKLPGPDGIGNIRPLVATGMVNPEAARRTVAAFTGGFKRTHGAFRLGNLAARNAGSHYGFIENGVVLSRLNPGLATVLVWSDGSVRMKTWTEADDALLPRIRHARQNGVPIIDWDPAAKSPVPGALVGQWGPGNWSGSSDSKLRTMRAGAALQRRDGKSFLIYAVFSSATPSAMARVFQAYGCEYALLLDMNALEHTYLATYQRAGARLIVNHLLKGMSVLDKDDVPRFLGYPDNRDFFSILRREEAGR